MSIDNFLRHRGIDETEPIPLIRPPGVAATGTCLYLQQELLSAGADGAVESLPGLGEGLVRDLSELCTQRLRELAEAAGLGPWDMSQLFVGTAATSGA